MRAVNGNTLQHVINLEILTCYYFSMKINPGGGLKKKIHSAHRQPASDTVKETSDYKSSAASFGQMGG